MRIKPSQEETTKPLLSGLCNIMLLVGIGGMMLMLTYYEISEAKVHFFEGSPIQFLRAIVRLLTTPLFWLFAVISIIGTCFRNAIERK